MCVYCLLRAAIYAYLSSNIWSCWTTECKLAVHHGVHIFTVFEKWIDHRSHLTCKQFSLNKFENMATSRAAHLNFSSGLWRSGVRTGRNKGWFGRIGLDCGVVTVLNRPGSVGAAIDCVERCWHWIGRVSRINLAVHCAVLVENRISSNGIN